MLFIRVPTGVVEVDWTVVSVTHDTVEIENGTSRRRQRIGWKELEARSRTAPAGWPRKAWFELLELARDMRAPGYLARRRQHPPFWVDPIESRDPDTRTALIAAIERFEDGDGSVVGTYVGGPASGRPCEIAMTAYPTPEVDGRAARYDSTHVQTKRGSLKVHVYLGDG